MRVATIVGNRPQFVKAAAVSGPLRKAHDEILVHTGQHYDDELSAVFFKQLDVPSPDFELRLGSGTNSAQTARMLGALEPLLAEIAPDAVLVYGDTNSTLAGGLAAAQLRLPVAHVEAGMRSFDRTMPEELNRVLTDHLSSLLLCPTPTAVANLQRESVAGRIELVGDVMADVAALVAARVGDDETPLAAAGVIRDGYLLVTAHRAGNVDDPVRLAQLVELLEGLPLPVVLPLHPRTRARLATTGLIGRLEQAPDVILLRTARLPRVRRAAARGARSADGLRRRPERGLPRRRAVRHVARPNRVGRDRDGGLERARRSRRRCRPCSPRRAAAAAASGALRGRTGRHARRRGALGRLRHVGLRDG